MAEKTMTDNDNRAVLTVGQVNAFIKQLIDSNRILASIYIRGEISNFTNHYRTGHLYFTLKDENGVISAVMFRSSAEKLKFLPFDGMKVVVHGRISAFVKTGQYQVYVDHIEPDGVGGLYIAFEQLKKKLADEGLFDPEIKKPLPKLPMRIGIITSPTGAAVRDMINVTRRRFPLAGIILYPALVQGEEAAAQLTAGVKFFNSQIGKSASVDVIIIGRGGGSIEDLWAFNDETLARTIAASEIPVISAVGHETDFTICDFAADMRAPTPSAAAELAVPDSYELGRKINNIIAHMELALTKMIKSCRGELAALSGSRALTSPQNFIDDKRMALDLLSGELESTLKLGLASKRADFAALTASLQALNPMSVISRGYAAVFIGDGELVKSTKQLDKGERFTLRLSDGLVRGEVMEIEEEKTETELSDDSYCKGDS